MLKFMGPHTFQPSNANDKRKKWFTNPKSTAKLQSQMFGLTSGNFYLF